jgi:hypothetical protein
MWSQGRSLQQRPSSQQASPRAWRERLLRLISARRELLCATAFEAQAHGGSEDGDAGQKFQTWVFPNHCLTFKRSCSPRSLCRLSRLMAKSQTGSGLTERNVALLRPIARFMWPLRP